MTMIKNTEAARIIAFLESLHPDFHLPQGIQMMNPFQDLKSISLVKLFYTKYYSDNHTRYFIFGINPGRLGGGITGIPFTDPEKLQIDCGIPNDLAKRQELSASFMYAMIQRFGGPKAFYERFFITAVSPLGFTRDGKNLNYYDDRSLLEASESFIIDCIKMQQSSLHTESLCFCLGEGENFKYLNKLNQVHHFFTEIIPLPHPRWIMQYRRKEQDKYINFYLDTFQSAFDQSKTIRKID